MKPLRAGVVGLGVGAQHVRAYADIPGVEVVAICDLDPGRLAEVGARHDVPERYGDARRITEHPDLDVVSICSYDDGHAAQACAALASGKHVMVEKPVALSRTEAEALVRAHADSGRLLTSNLILRRAPRFAELKRRIAAGEFGEIVYMEGDYLHEIVHKITDGWRGRMAFYCVVFGGGIHLVDLMRWLIGREVEEVCGMSNKLHTRASAYRFDDVFVNLLRFDGGALAKTLTTFAPRRPKFHALSVYGTRRCFVNDLGAARLYDGDDPDGGEAITAPYPGVGKGGLIGDFVAAIREGREPEVRAADVFRVMDVCFAAEESVRARRTQKVSYLT